MSKKLLKIKKRFNPKEVQLIDFFGKKFRVAAPMNYKEGDFVVVTNGVVTKKVPRVSPTEVKV